MAISHVDTKTATQASATSVTATKPTGTASGDLLIAFFTSNNQNATAPTGWTQIFDTTIETFRGQVFRRVAGGSEPANYQFSVASVAPLVLSIIALRGNDPTTPLDLTTQFSALTAAAEPLTTPTVTGGTNGRLMYFRSVRRLGSVIPTFTSAGTELADVGVFSGGNVCYSQGIYLGNSEYSGSGTKSGLGITCSQTENHNIIATLGIRAASIPADLSVDLPSIQDVSGTGDVDVPAEVDVELPVLELVEVEAFYGDPEAEVEVAIPLSMSVSAESDVGGPLDAAILPRIRFWGETRRFAENVVSVPPDERWLVVTQDGYYLGTREAVRDFPIFVMLPELDASFSGNVSPLGETVFVDAVTHDGEVAVQSLLDEVAASVVAEDAAVLTGDLGEAEEASATAAANDATVMVAAVPDAASASVEARDAILFQTAAEPIMASVAVLGITVNIRSHGAGTPLSSGQANDAVARIGSPAGHGSTIVTAYVPSGAEAPAGTASATVAANDASVRVKPSAGCALIRAANNVATNAPAGHAAASSSAFNAQGDDLLKFAQSIGNGTNTSYTVTHNFGSRDVIVRVYDNTTFEEVEAKVLHATTNTVTVEFAVAPASNAHRVVVLYSSV